MPVARSGAICRKLRRMFAPGIKARSRRPALLRHWLLLCVVVVLGQASAPAFAWCLHDAERGAHLESVLTDCADHVEHAPDPGDIPCHDDGGITNHLMLDAETPGKVTPTAAVTDFSAPPRFELRLSLDEWLPPAAGPSASPAAPASDEPDLPGVGRLIGHTTHLLI